jgi:hypothetical protein
MRRHVVDSLAVDPDLAPIPEALEILLAVHRASPDTGAGASRVTRDFRHHDLQTMS